MNFQKILDIVPEDQDNTALCIICAGLEEQEYKVRIDGKDVNSAEIFDRGHKDLEDNLGPLSVAVFGDSSMEQESSLGSVNDCR